MTKGELIDHPPHYGGDTPFEAIKIIERFGLVEDFRLASAYKYLSRCGKKEGVTEQVDLGKTLWYLKRFKAAIDQGHGDFPVYNGSRDDLPEIEDIANAISLANPWAEEALICVLEMVLHSEEHDSLAQAIQATQKALAWADGLTQDKPERELPSRQA